MKKFVTADLHFFHAMIIEYCNRPFKNIKVMQTALIQNWNRVVSNDDIVYVLGDFAFGDAHQMFRRILKKLNGRKVLIYGNHDDNRPRFYISAGFESVHYPYLEVDDFVLVHDPELSQADTNKKFICGHVHNLFVQCKNVINCGVDVWNYKPVDMEVIRETYIGE